LAHPSAAALEANQKALGFDPSQQSASVASGPPARAAFSAMRLAAAARASNDDETAERGDSDQSESGSGSEYSEDGPVWVAGWSTEHKHVYFFNIESEQTLWKLPAGTPCRPMSAKHQMRRQRDAA